MTSRTIDIHCDTCRKYLFSVQPDSNRIGKKHYCKKHKAKGIGVTADDLARAMEEMRNKRENTIETYLRKQCMVRGALVLKCSGYRGIVDRQVVWPRRGTPEIHFVETKRPKGGRFEPLQLRWHAKLRKMGHIVLVLNTKELIDTYVSGRKVVSNHSTLSLS